MQIQCGNNKGKLCRIQLLSRTEIATQCMYLAAVSKRFHGTAFLFDILHTIKCTCILVYTYTSNSYYVFYGVTGIDLIEKNYSTVCNRFIQ